MTMLRAFVVFSAFLSCGDPYASQPAGGAAPAAAASRPPVDVAGPSDTPATVAAPDDAIVGEIHYVEVLLGGAAAGDTLPMIVAIHGRGDDPRNFGHLFDNFDAPARLILPRGLAASDDGGWLWFTERARTTEVDALARGIANAADQLAPAITELASTRPTLGKPIVTGFSQGGMIAFAIAVAHPDAIGLALPIGGSLPPPLVPARKPASAPPIVAFHGTDDAAVPYPPTQAAVAELAKLGFDVELRTYPGVGHVITPELHRDLDDRLGDALRALARAKH
jgi:phospholipase/carboxylesterase